MKWKKQKILKWLLLLMFPVCFVLGGAYTPAGTLACGVANAAGRVPGFTVTQTFTTSGRLPDPFHEMGIYELVPVTGGAPLPKEVSSQDGEQEGTTTAAYRFTLTGNETIDFPIVTEGESGQTMALCFDHVGQYEYTIRQVTENADRYTYDRKIYSVSIMIINSGDGIALGALWITNENGSKPDQITFSNSYTGETQENPDTLPQTSNNGDTATRGKAVNSLVKTGDDAPMIGCIAVILLTSIVEVAILYYRRREQ